MTCKKVEVKNLAKIVRTETKTHIVTQDSNHIIVVWIKSAVLREGVAKLLGQPVEKLGDAQWIGHILKRLHLLDDARRKRGMDGMIYAIQPLEVIDMMRRYDVTVIPEKG